MCDNKWQCNFDIGGNLLSNSGQSIEQQDGLTNFHSIHEKQVAV